MSYYPAVSNGLEFKKIGEVEFYFLKEYSCDQLEGQIQQTNMGKYAMVVSLDSKLNGKYVISYCENGFPHPLDHEDTYEEAVEYAEEWARDFPDTARAMITKKLPN